MLDRGFDHFSFWLQLIEDNIHFITRLKKGAAIKIQDLSDAVAWELSLPFERISQEMIYRGLYHFYSARQKGLTSDPVKYFADPKNRDLGIVKQKRKSQVKLIIAPFPDKMPSSPDFFFQAKSKSLLTSTIQA